MTHAPAFDRPPDLLGAGCLRGWFTDPPGAVVQIAQPARGTKEMAEWLVGPMFLRLRGRFPTSEGMVLVLDLSLMDGRDTAARTVVIDRAREAGQIFGRVYIIAPLKTNAVYLTTLHAAATLLNALGRDIHIETSLIEVIQRCDLKPA